MISVGECYDEIKRNGRESGGRSVRYKAAVVVFGWLIVSVTGHSHHNINAFFNVRERIMVEGVITEVRMVNPHSRITMEVENDQGALESWTIETGDVTIMTENHGWTQDSVPVGSRVIAHGFPTFSGRPMLALIAFTFEDGREVRANLDRYLRAPQDN
jgi:hypothetical protein